MSELGMGFLDSYLGNKWVLFKVFFQGQIIMLKYSFSCKLLANFRRFSSALNMGNFYLFIKTNFILTPSLWTN